MAWWADFENKEIHWVASLGEKSKFVVTFCTNERYFTKIRRWKPEENLVRYPKIINILHFVGYVNTKPIFLPIRQQKTVDVQFHVWQPAFNLSMGRTKRKGQDRTGQDDSALISGTLSKIVITESDKSRHGVSREHNQESIFRCRRRRQDQNSSWNQGNATASAWNIQYIR